MCNFDCRNSVAQSHKFDTFEERAKQCVRVCTSIYSQVVR